MPSEIVEEVEAEVRKEEEEVKWVKTKKKWFGLDDGKGALSFYLDFYFIFVCYVFIVNRDLELN